MKIRTSILIPSRDRLPFLRLAVESARAEAPSDTEIIVSDNGSGDDVAAWVRTLGDPRVVYTRTAGAGSLPVTESWNHALSVARGDIIVMLGDDDGLLRGWHAAVARMLETHPQADVIYTGALLYGYPGVFPDHPDGLLLPYSYADIFRMGQRILPRADAHAMVAAAMRFRAAYGFNMQFAVFRRRMVDALLRFGPFFQSPFPDYYAMNMLFLLADTIVVDPTPRVVIGVTPRSYGFFHANDREAEGIAMLGGSPDADDAKRLAHVVLPGSYINTGWLYALDRVETRLGRQLGLHVDRARYRRLQIAEVALSGKKAGELPPLLSAEERAAFHALRGALRLSGGHRRAKSLVRRALGQTVRWNPTPIAGSFRALDDVVRVVVPPAWTPNA